MNRLLFLKELARLYVSESEHHFIGLPGNGAAVFLYLSIRTCDVFFCFLGPCWGLDIVSSLLVLLFLLYVIREFDRSLKPR